MSYNFNAFDLSKEPLFSPSPLSHEQLMLVENDTMAWCANCEAVRPWLGDNQFGPWRLHGELRPFCLVDEAKPVLGGIKFDSDKPRLELLSNYAITEMAHVLAYGASKYGDDNWRKGIAWRRLTGAALRHILAFQDGEDLDPETNRSHLAHAMCMIMFALESTRTHPELDDRWKSC